MITIEEYFGAWRDHKDVTPEVLEAATAFLEKCNALEAEMVAACVEFRINDARRCNISGVLYGGFRPQDCPIGAAHSSHKEGRGLDRYDPRNAIDNWIMGHQDALVRHGLYIEAPDCTQGWSHWTDKPPRSGKRVFWP